MREGPVIVAALVLSAIFLCNFQGCDDTEDRNVTYHSFVQCCTPLKGTSKRITYWLRP